MQANGQVDESSCSEQTAAYSDHSVWHARSRNVQVKALQAVLASAYSFAHAQKLYLYFKVCESCQQRLRTAVPQQRASHLGADPRHECAPTAEVGVLQPVQQMEAGTIATS